MGDFRAANHHLWSEIVWPHFWAIQLWLTVLIFVYCAIRELIRAIGRDRSDRCSSASPRPGVSDIHDHEDPRRASLNKFLDSLGRRQNMSTSVLGGLRIYSRF
jgi:hypothetical protein